MSNFWFVAIVLIFVAFVILDGFDLGAGIIYLFVAKTEEEKRTIHSAIGPVWDANELWLVAGGATMFFAFPQLYATAFSGFYLALIIILWFLILRGVSLEFRGLLINPLWHSFWDSIFSVSSMMIIFLLGVLLGNIIRGVPLQRNGFFFEPFWTSFIVDSEPGIFDWFTVLVGIMTLSILANHGANYLSVKTEGKLQIRSSALSKRSWWASIVLLVFTTLATYCVCPLFVVSFEEHIWGPAFILLACVAAISIRYFHRRKDEKQTVLASSVFIASIICAVAFGNYPVLLRATTHQELSIVIDTGQSVLATSIYWWTIGVSFVIGYFIILYKLFRGKISSPYDGYHAPGSR